MSNYYAQEVCSPSRASLLTGRYPLSVGMQYGMVNPTFPWGLSLEEQTIAEVFKNEGYSTYMYGKWHLGHYSPNFLPTSRGFDHFVGFVNGQTYPWSKRCTEHPAYLDIMEADTSCYYPYNNTDYHEYSTSFYTARALEVINKHGSIDSDPFFLYMAYQAVHDPYYDDNDEFEGGMPDSYLPASILDSIQSYSDATLHREYLKSLYKFDEAVGQIYSTLIDNNLMDNTYIIFASDNGGCYRTGGFNGPYRGSKGSLFEGGVKVDSFISSPLLKKSGLVYDKLFHVSDWFPTILSLVDASNYVENSDKSLDGVDHKLFHVSDWFPTILSLVDASNYVENSDKSLDGVDHSLAWYDSSIIPRSTMLYNMYQDIEAYTFNIWTNGSFAVRNNQYKLMHTYYNDNYDEWYLADGSYEYDDVQTSGHCNQYISGNFSYWLFDLVNDPYEKVNLYDLTDSYIADVKSELYALLPGYLTRASTIYKKSNKVSATSFWDTQNDRVLPWILSSDDTLQYCNLKD
eukprot:CAMPEP_0196767784 /NCGR_PEP_ID=MMETSP1095-20130614/41957_1 /TAXON_ID=96789 ORGANISM="Chromulina nebulosa, Strain UTEXLB2642" /NCGR_SAMPLE_ID=MMETSP1095 /ASSEMBLY_ACC=CAM_ASM_000446 /LENGTH=514 /DNA_ID=CAMNT_0042136431 /DNA_START=150 /DNA_END=1694 /DNA_ORIENTATION=+